MAVVILQVFSGLPDPFWALSERDEAELGRRLEGLVVVATPRRPPGGLGYRGLEVRGERGVFVVAEGLVWSGGRVWLDAERSLERWLLANPQAPPDLARKLLAAMP